MFPTFISILDIQSWWEVPSIAHFCSLFRSAFNLLDFDIEDLEEALLTDGTEEPSWLQELIVRLLSGCLANNDISTSNYQMFLRRLFRQKCQEHDRYNPFNTDVDFQILPLRTKVDILYALCDFRLDAEDVLDQLKNLEADSLRVEPLGYDGNDSAYWYFYGTRLYREDFKKKNNKKKSIWQVICFTEDDWLQLAKKFQKSSSKAERHLYHTLNENFVPELNRLFKEKEKLARKRLLDRQPRRTSNRLRKGESEGEKDDKEKEENDKEKDEVDNRKQLELRRQEAYERRCRLKAHSDDSQSEASEERYEMAGAKSRDKKAKTRQRKLSEASTSSKDAFMTTKSSKRTKGDEKNASSKSSSKPTSVGRQTNNSLAAATGQIVIQSVANTNNKKKLKTSQVFRQTDEDLQTGMHKILDFVKNHDDAWPFAEPVEEKYAPNYYSIIRKPMDLQSMEDRLESGYYKSYSKFRGDFQLIVQNCRLYNGADNEYTEMVDNLLQVFERATEKYLDQISSSDDEIAVEYVGNDVNSDKSKKNSDKTTKSKRKPMLVAQTDKKRDRSLSEESLERRSESPVSDKNAKPPVKSKKLEKPDKVTKNKAKVNKPSSKKDKETKKSSKIDEVKENKLKKLAKKDKEKKVSKSRSSSPPPSDCSSPPPSRTPSPEVRTPSKKQAKKRSSQDLSDENDSPKKISKYDDKSKHKKLKTKQSPPPSPKPKDKHNKLRETIEKLKAKSEISKQTRCEYDFVVDDNPKENNKSKKHEVKSKSSQKEKPNNKHLKKDHLLDLDDGGSTGDSDKKSNKKTASNKTTNNNKNVATIEALTLATEQTLKDINKWLDDTPKFEFSSASNSPSYTLDEFDSLGASKPNDTTKKPEKPMVKKDTKDIKRRPFRDPVKFFKRREVQRTIDRLQPGKSKGNLIATVQSANKTDETFALSTLSKIKDTKNSLIVKPDSNAPQLSLGSVLDSFGKHKFVDDQVKEESKVEGEGSNEVPVKDALKDVVEKEEVEKKLKEEEEIKEVKEKMEKEASEGGATPNLSAWFKAFGAPKVPAVQPKKPELKPDGKENEKLEENFKVETRKVVVPDPSPTNPDSPQPGMPVARQRRVSTGSSMSERSSFSQDSPRVGIDEHLGAYPAPYPSPLHRSPSGASPVMASPRPDVSPKAAAYPTFNGQIRVGFYQDTVSNKSSPDKSCSPRDNPQSPAYAQFSEQHVYTPNTTQNTNYPTYANSPFYSHAPNYSSTNPTPPYNTEMSPHSYYDTTKSLTDQYQAKTAQNYTTNSPASNLSSPVTPHPQHSPTVIEAPPPTFQPQPPIEEPKPKDNKIVPPQSAMFPVKKRAYNEAEVSMQMQYQQHQQMEPQVKEKELPKPYIHQNIPEPKALNMHPVQQQAPLPPPPDPSRNVGGYPPHSAPPTNPYNVYNGEQNYPLNIPSTRTLPDKIDMSKYTNMGYNGPEVNFSRSLPQYNRPELNYSHPSHSVAPSSQAPPPQQAPPQTHPPPNQTIRRYDNSALQMSYKSMELPPNQSNVQQQAHNYSNQHQNARPPDPPRQHQEAPSGYKPEVSIPRPTYNAPIDVEQPLGLRSNMANLSHIVDRCCPPSDERMLNLQPTPTSYYSDKAHLFNKPISTSSSSLPMFSQSNMPTPPMYNQNMQVNAPMYNHQRMPDPPEQPKPIPEKKTKKRKSKAQSDVHQQQQQPPPPQPTGAPPNPTPATNQGFQSYAGLKNATSSSSSLEPSAISLKTSVVPGSAFNFGPTPSGIGLGGGLYGDKDSYPSFLEDFRSAAPNYYMAAAAAHHRSTPESNEKQPRVAAHQSSAPQSAGYPFLGAPQARPSYPIGGPFIPPGQAQLMDPSSPLYQHYLQAGVLNQGLLGAGAYPPGYHPALSMRQPYESMTRPPWL